MAATSINKDMIRLRDLSSVFSRSAFTYVLNYNDYSHFNWLSSKYDTLNTALLRKYPMSIRQMMLSLN